MTVADTPRRSAVRQRAFELVRFVAVGVSSAVLYLVVYTAAVLAGVPFVLASLVAFLPVAVYGYVVHDRWTFQTRTPSRRGLARWLFLQGTVWGLNALVLWALVRAGADRVVAQVLILPLLPPITYVLSRRRVFGAR